MKVAWAAILVVFLLVFVGPFCSADDEWQEALKFGFDGRDWNLGWSDDKPDAHIMEFVVDKQTVDNWHELFTYQYFPGLQQQATPQDMKDNFLRHLRQTVPSIKATDLVDTPQESMFEWKISDVPKQNQYEIDRILKGKQGIHFLHYVIKDPNISSAEREKWIGILKKAHIVQSSEQAPEASKNSPAP